MVERIDIEVDEGVLAENDAKRQRLAKARRFEPVDRVPVELDPNQWTMLTARGRSAGDYVRSPEDNLREQILNIKWRMENVRDDAPIPTERLDVTPDLGCLRGTEFPMEVTWHEDQPPKCRHPLHDAEQIDDLEVPDPAGGVNAKRIEWFGAMGAMADDFDVRLNGRRLPVKVSIGQCGGPVPAAFALAGENLFLWLATEPRRVHRLMRVVSESHVRCIRFFDELAGRDPVHPIGLGFDAAEMMGPEMFREFVVPYCLEIWRQYPGRRGFHNCGRNEHLLDIYRDELGVRDHNGFGACVRPELLAEKMGGRVVLTGGPDPCLVKSGSYERVLAEARRYIEILGPRGGFVLSTGGGIPPGTPLENYEAFTEASRAVGAGPGH